VAFEPPSYQSLLEFGLALGLGGLIGIERERHRPERLMLAGVRTYPLVALSGLVAAYLGTWTGQPLILSVGAVIIGAFAILMYWVRQSQGTYGLTSPIALFSTYFVGVLVGSGRHWEAILTGLAIALLLFTKERLHHLAEVLTPHEMEGALYFLVLAFILYPVTPNEPVDPWDLLNLRKTLLIVLLVSAISFASFLTVRFYGDRFGLPFSGFLGGLVNSEATTASLARLYAHKKTLQRGACVGILLAVGTMFLRNIVIAAIAEPSLQLARTMAVAVLVPSLVYLVWAFVEIRGPASGPSTRLELRSPFAFRPAFVFAFWFTLVSVVTGLLVRSLGERGLYAAALGGLVSAGAVTASMGALVAAGHANLGPAADVAVIASLISAANKPFIARWFASSHLMWRVLAPTIIAITTGALLLWIF
jgi:uncharacterized membrane protein (DUF4010 family)